MRYSASEFKSVYITCYPAAMRQAMSILHCEDEASDVVQEVFLKLWESDVIIDNHKAFIIRSVRNACLNRVNMLDSRERIKQRLALESSTDRLDREPPGDEVLNAINRLLTSREQQVVELIYADGLSYKEAAAILGVSVAAINKNIVAALKKLRNHFKTSKS